MSEDRCSSCGRPFRPDDALCGRCGTLREDATGAASPEVTASPQPSATATPSGEPKNKLIKVLPMAIGFTILPLVLIFAIGDCGSAEGQMAVTASPHGEWTFVTTGCASMQPYGQMGANLHADGHNDGAVYVTLDHATGHLVELEVPGSCQNSDGTDCTVFPVPRDSCASYDVALDYTNTTVNDVRLVQGHVTLDCTLEDGSRIQGSIVFDGC